MTEVTQDIVEPRTTPIFVLGTPGMVREPQRFDIATTLKVVGMNTGNLVFQYAASKILTDEKTFIGLSELPYNAAIANKGGKFLLFPAANHLRIADWSGMNNFLAASKLPIIVLGLGAQSPSIGGERSTIDALKTDPHVSRLVAILRDKGAFISVRGDFTGEVCNALGLKDVEILGCPSLMLNDNINLGRMIAKKIELVKGAASPKAALAAAAPFEIRGGPKQDLERRLFGWIRALRGLYYQQSGGEAVYALASRNFAHISLSAAISIKQILAPELGLGQFVEYFMNRARIRLDAEKWKDELAKLDICFGTRVHGNMIAIAGGTPGVLIAHDSRTGEMSKTMHLPELAAEDALKSQRLQDALAAMSFDPAAFDRSRTQKARSYCAAFDRLGLSMAPHLRALAGASDIAPGAEPKLATNALS